jgi:hypothetical protein
MGRNSLDEGFKSSSYLTEVFLDPEFGHAGQANKAAFNKAYNVEEDLWNWLERPDNRLRLARFGASMNGLRNMSSAGAILEGSVIFFCSVDADRHLTSIYRIGRVRLGKSSRGLASGRHWRRRGRAVVNARYSPSASSLRCSGPRVCRRGCGRSMCIEFKYGTYCT